MVLDQEKRLLYPNSSDLYVRSAHRNLRVQLNKYRQARPSNALLDAGDERLRIHHVWHIPVLSALPRSVLLAPTIPPR
jgi:hypothetical protein